MRDKRLRLVTSHDLPSEMTAARTVRPSSPTCCKVFSARSIRVATRSARRMGSWWRAASMCTLPKLRGSRGRGWTVGSHRVLLLKTVDETPAEPRGAAPQCWKRNSWALGPRVAYQDGGPHLASAVIAEVIGQTNPARRSRVIRFFMSAHAHARGHLCGAPGTVRRVGVCRGFRPTQC